jgi:hypothetical protein
VVENREEKTIVSRAEVPKMFTELHLTLARKSSVDVWLWSQG